MGAGEGAKRLYLTALSVTAKPLLTIVCCTMVAKDGDCRAAVTTVAVVRSEVTVYETADEPPSRPRRRAPVVLVPMLANARSLKADVGSPRAVETPERNAAEKAALFVSM